MNFFIDDAIHFKAFYFRKLKVLYPRFKKLNEKKSCMMNCSSLTLCVCCTGKKYIKLKSRVTVSTIFFCVSTSFFLSKKIIRIYCPKKLLKKST